MTTIDEVREVLRTLPDDYLRRYVEAFEDRRLSCFEGNACTRCAITVMYGADDYRLALAYFGRSSTVERFYEAIGAPASDLSGFNATPLYDECVLELARRAVPAVVEAVR